MNESTEVLSLFEGLNPEQAKQLRERIIPTLQQVREQIKQGADNMPQVPQPTPETPRQAQQRLIDVLETESRQLIGRGAPESELIAQQGRIDQEKAKLARTED